MIADNIKELGIISSIVLGTVLFLGTVFSYLENDEAPKYFKTTLIFFIFSIILATIIPTTKEAMIIVAGGATIEYVQKDENLQKIPLKATEVVAQYLDSKLEELEKNKKND